MSARTQNNIFYAFPLVLLITACICTSSLPETSPTVTPPPSEVLAAAPEPVASPASARSEPAAAPTAAPGSFEDFRSFAADIATALQAHDSSFFYEHASSSTWLCLGDETVGVCKGVPADTTLKGIPVAREWNTYEVYSQEEYQQRWQTAFAEQSGMTLAAIAHLFGDNPFMPMASQASLAILEVTEEGDPSAVQEARVLFFEYRVDAWYLTGELVTVEEAQAWINNTCSRCYDPWETWQE